jgi:hypothetical protein
MKRLFFLFLLLQVSKETVQQVQKPVPKVATPPPPTTIVETAPRAFNESMFLKIENEECISKLEICIELKN